MAKARTARVPKEEQPAISIDQVMQDLRYVPVLRFRQEERAALQAVKLSAKVLPLIEIVQEVPRAKNNADFGIDYTTELSQLHRPVIVDFPTYEKIGVSLKPEVQNFLRPIQASPQQRVTRFQRLASVVGLIPAVSYATQAPYVPGTIEQLAKALRPVFGRLAFRLFDYAFAAALLGVTRVAQVGDIVVLDLDDAPYGNPALLTKYAQVNALQSKGCTTVLIRSVIPDALANTTLLDDQPVTKIDNSLCTAYQGYGFNAFGDFGGIRKDLPRTGGTVSPGFIFFSWQGTLSIGYKGRIQDLSEFKRHIVPSVLASQYYRQFGTAHHNACPGCKRVNSIATGPDTGKSQGLWKRIAMMHYLYTMEEYL